MSSPPDSYHYPDASPPGHESGSEPPPTLPLPDADQSWPPTVPIDSRSTYPQAQYPSDPVGSSFEVHGAEVCSCHNSDNPPNYFSLVSDPQATYDYYNYPGHSYPLQSTSSIPGAGTDAIHHARNATDDNVPFQSFDYYSDHPYSGFADEYSHHQHGYTSYDAAFASTQPPVHDTGTHRAQDTLQTSSSPSSSTQVFSLSHRVPVYETGTTSIHPTPDRLTLDGADSGWINTGAGQYSHQTPVAASSSTNQIPVPGPSRLPPSSPERKRPLPWNDPTTPQRVVPRPRHERASTVHSASPVSQRRGSNPEANRRGPEIPQERYTTSTISPYTSPDRHPVITFDLVGQDQIGIPIIDILHKTGNFAHIRDGNEKFDMEKQTFTLRILWPGYKLWSKTIAAKDWKKSRGPVTRVKLAEAVAIAIQDLFNKYHDKPYDPDYAEWNVGETGVRLDQICLVALHHVSRGSWQPELCLLAPRD